MIIIDLLLVLFFWVLSSFRPVFIEWRQFGLLGLAPWQWWWHLALGVSIVLAFFRPLDQLFSCRSLDLFFVAPGL